ncbi:hypothetical protein CW356_11740, partial [Streptococcus pneumoniae]
PSASATAWLVSVLPEPLTPMTTRTGKAVAREGCFEGMNKSVVVAAAERVGDGVAGIGLARTADAHDNQDRQGGSPGRL